MSFLKKIIPLIQKHHQHITTIPHLYPFTYIEQVSGLKFQIFPSFSIAFLRPVTPAGHPMSWRVWHWAMPKDSPGDVPPRPAVAAPNGSAEPSAGEKWRAWKMGRYQWDMYHDPNLYGDRIIMNYRYSDYIRWYMLRSYIFLFIYSIYYSSCPKKLFIYSIYYSICQSIDDPPSPMNFVWFTNQPCVFFKRRENLGIWWGYNGDHISTMGSVLG